MPSAGQSSAADFRFALLILAGFVFAFETMISLSIVSHIGLSHGLGLETSRLLLYETEVAVCVSKLDMLAGI